MPFNKTENHYPSLLWRIYSVWFRHLRVYSQHIVSNGFPPFLEPLIFLVGIGLGLGHYIGDMDGIPYKQFLGIGLLVTSSMWTAAFECSYGTFIRMEFEKVYDGMLAAPITAENLIVGEILWAGTKGLFFSSAVLIVMSLVGIVPLPSALTAPLIGFLNGLMFGCLSLVVTSVVRTINHFNFYMTGLISPMFFFAGAIFPVKNLPDQMQLLAELIPLTHSIRLMRTLCGQNSGGVQTGIDIIYIVLFIGIMGYFAVKRLKNRLIS
jgi:lipooligosaccharide transport system permease protein